MQGPRIALVHALSEAVAPINDAFARCWPQARPVNLMDDSLSRDLARDGSITDGMTQRFIMLTRYAVSCGADAVQFTCSAFNRCIEAARDAVQVPVLKPDEAMIEAALARGKRLGVVATFAPTIESCSEQIRTRARSRDVAVEIEAVHVAGALEAFRAGDTASHDQRISVAAHGLAHCDVVLLAQYSMARAAPSIHLPANCHLLTSPDAAVNRLKALLA